MGTPAELHALAKLDDTHKLAILLAKQSHRPQLLCLGNGHGTMFLQCNGMADVDIHLLLHLAYLFAAHLGEV